jgi:hypothetical protein
VKSFPNILTPLNSNGFSFSLNKVKYAGFNSKPITFGLLKRNLGGISQLNQDNKLSIGDSGVLSTSSKGDQFHGESKVSKMGGGFTASNQLKIGKFLLTLLAEFIKSL